MSSPLAQNLLDWYAGHARNLPWRDHPDPYAVWVSEIMLQQTRVETVEPYFRRWMALFPDVQALARASLRQVLNAWEGLGYYSRARNLHKAARLIVADHAGHIPADVTLLRKLPGIGRYTAGAIASLAFGLDEPAVDGNIRRVLARYFNIEQPLGASGTEERFWALAREHLPAGQAGAFNQALMDLGSMVCTPRQPQCERCPLAAACQARALGVQDERPVRLPRPKTPHYTVTAAVIRRGGRILIAQRPFDGLLGGLWEFPGGKLQPGEDLAACLQREICEELGVDVAVGASLGVYRHAYTHFRVTLHAFGCCLGDGARPEPIQAAGLRWVAPHELASFPMGKIDRQIAVRLAADAPGPAPTQEQGD